MLSPNSMSKDKQEHKKHKQEDNKGITVSREEDMAEWYGQVCLKSELADYAPVKGCMIIRPLGYGLWENMQKQFDARIKAKGVKNTYFPLFIPESFFHKEQKHAQGFTPEVAWIANTFEDGEKLAIRPTSETVIYDSFSKWIRSHRDLPMRINQWCNVVRWETEATKLFLRTREFLWQEGHCVYATEEECKKETELFLREYESFMKESLALYVLPGYKTEKEKFAGAQYTLTVEAFMPDGKALQCGTSHNLGQGFAKSFEILFKGKDEKEHHPWQSSWGISTRLIGAIVMAHGDDKGLILPPKIAPVQIVIVPILFDKTKEETLKKCEKVKEELTKAGYLVELDDREDTSPGWKYAEWELKGVPLRAELGPKDLEKKQVVLVRRDTREKVFTPESELTAKAKELLDSIQNALYENSKKTFQENVVKTTSWKEFEDVITNKKMVKTMWCGETSCEDDIKEKVKGVTARLIPLDTINHEVSGKCVHCGKKAMHEVYFSRSY
jgi:prolyl-tRNA synthetase